MRSEVIHSKFPRTRLPFNFQAARQRSNPWLIAVTVMSATFMEVLDTAVANVALRHIAGSFAANADESTWVLTSYLISNAIVLTARARSKKALDDSGFKGFRGDAGARVDARPGPAALAGPEVLHVGHGSGGFSGPGWRGTWEVEGRPRLSTPSRSCR